MYLYNWWRLTERRVHEREVELALSGQRVAAEGHGDLLHRDFKSSRRERFHEDVGRPTDGSKRTWASWGPSRNGSAEWTGA